MVSHDWISLAVKQGTSLPSHRALVSSGGQGSARGPTGSAGAGAVRLWPSCPFPAGPACEAGAHVGFTE